MRIFTIGLLLILSSLANTGAAQAEISSIPPEDQEKDRAGCKVANSKTRTGLKPWSKSINNIDPELEDTAVGYWLGPCLTWHTTGLHPTGDEKSIGLATLASQTPLKKGKWRLVGKYVTDGAAERKVTLQIFNGPVGISPLIKPIALGRRGKISAAFDLPTDGPVTLLLRSECHNFVCWGELTYLSYNKR